MSFELPLDDLKEMRRQTNMETARLEHAILQTIINHVAEEHLSREQIIMALVNVTAYWQKKIILAILTKARREEQEDG